MIPNFVCFFFNQLNKDGPKGPNALHCDVCDLALTSLQHAKQHNMGKRHKKLAFYLKCKLFAI